MSVSDYTKARAAGVRAGESTHSAGPKPDQPGLAETGTVVDDSKTCTRIEFVDITEKERPGGEHPIITLTSSRNRAKEDNGRYSEYALRLIRKVDKEGNSVSTELEIRSPILRQALQSILASYSFLNLAADPIVIKKPYAAIFHFRHEIRKYYDDGARTGEEREHLKILLDPFIKLHIHPTEKIYLEEVPKGRIRFDLLWTLFRAEDDIVLQTEYFSQIYRVVHCEEKVDKETDEPYFLLHVWRWGYNAGKFGPAAETLTIPYFSSTRSITQLPCFPVKQLSQKNQEGLYRRLVKRGHSWRQLIKPTHRQYDGPIWIDPPEGKAQTPAKLVVSHTNERIVSDHKLHVEENFWLADKLVGAHGFRLEDPIVSKSGPYDYFGYRSRLLLRADSSGKAEKRILTDVECHDDDENYVMTDEEAWLSPARLRGFTLTSKQWAFFLVEQVSEISYREDSFSMLEIDPQIKDIIRALVEMHSQTADKFDDIILEKGKGIIMSLEGPPGAGKTLTAESVAELTHRPLYAISTGELSTMPEVAEGVLRAIFARAVDWNAILLLDEADLFLTKRTADDMRRNAFVTIFLRLLEYYKGIMFLTSNRVEEIDPAFSSRIHLKVGFEAPDPTKRGIIWKNLLHHRKECRNWAADVFDRLGRDLDLNGREIKNLIGPALAIAAYRKEPLSEDMIRLIYYINHRGGKGKKVTNSTVKQTPPPIEDVDLLAKS